MLPEMDTRIQTAAQTLEQMILEAHRDERGVHINTVLSTTAAVTAEAVQRATIPEVQLYGDRGVLFSEAAENMLWRDEGGNVLDYIAFTAQEAGLTPERMPDLNDIFKATSGAMGKSEVPFLTIPEAQRPHFWCMAGATYVRPQVLEIYQRFGLKPEEAVLAATLVLCRLLNGTQEVLSPDISFRLVLETLAGALRLHPVSPEDLEQMTKP